jgi:hypothetical protein
VRLTGRLLAGIAGVALAAACSPADPTKRCTAGFLGSPSNPPDFDFLVVLADDSVAPLNDHDRVPMIEPPQGGRVIFVGVRATNVDGCLLQLQGVLRDETSQRVQIDSRTVNLIPTGDGWGVSGLGNAPVSAAIASFSNIPVCPWGSWSTTDLYGSEYLLEVTITDRGGRGVTKTIHVTPECGEPDKLAECLCICKAWFVGGPCETMDADTGAAE